MDFHNTYDKFSSSQCDDPQTGPPTLLPTTPFNITQDTQLTITTSTNANIQNLLRSLKGIIRHGTNKHKSDQNQRQQSSSSMIESQPPQV